MLWLALPAVAALAAANRWRLARNANRAYAARFPVDAEGIVEGAHGFTLQGTNGRALLLLHGSGDTPNSLKYLAQRLHDAGYTVSVPLLPGHGRSPRIFANTTAADYLSGAARDLDALRHGHDWFGVIGLSMGGAIAAALTERAGDVRLLVLLAPYLIPPPSVTRAVAVSPLWTLVMPYPPGRGEASVHDKTASLVSRAYGTFSRGALRALMGSARAGHAALLRLRVPVLVINSEQDNRIPRAMAEQALQGVQAPMDVHWVSGCGHVITVDYCKDEVASLVLAFLARHTT